VINFFSMILLILGRQLQYRHVPYADAHFGSTAIGVAQRYKDWNIRTALGSVPSVPAETK
jgi:hypothetical protein